MRILYSRTLLTIALSCLIYVTNAQNYRLEAGINLGASNYLGDIGGKYLQRRDGIVDIKMRMTKPMIGLYGKYAVGPRLGLRLGFGMGQIAGDDKYTSNPERNDRNLSFRNTIFEGSFTAEYEFYEAYNVGKNSRYRVDYNMYLILGAGYFMHNPQAQLDGTWYDLQPLQTNRVSYSLSGISYIGGFGMDFTLKRNYKIGFRFTTMLTNTDYLDDISGPYPSVASFNTLNDKDVLALRLMDRRLQDNDIPSGGPQGGDPRGNPNNKDSYLFASFNFAYVFKGKGGKYNRAFHNGYVRKRGGRVKIQRFFAF